MALHAIRDDLQGRGVVSSTSKPCAAATPSRSLTTTQSRKENRARLGGRQGGVRQLPSIKFGVVPHFLSERRAAALRHWAVGSSSDRSKVLAESLFAYSMICEWTGKMVAESWR